MQRRTSTVIRSLAIAIAGTWALTIALFTGGCGERRPCNAPVKSLDAADSTAPAQ